MAIKAIASNSINVVIGCEDGSVKVFDVRKNQPVLRLQHQYRLPIKQLSINSKHSLLISADEKIMKFYNLHTGSLFTSKPTHHHPIDLEPTSQINAFTQVPDSGMFLVAQEQPRIGIYFIPQLDTAPAWCPFLDNLTEELEEEESQTVYDEFKFVSHDELERLDALHLLDTKMVKQYMHGYLMHLKLYQKLLNLKGLE